MRFAAHVGALAVGTLALRAAADLSGGSASPFVKIFSANGFVPVTWSEPTNGVGFGGDDRHGGSGPVPFAGWVDFGLLGDPSVTVEWDFTNDAPSRWITWSIERLDAQGTPLAGVSWDGAAWQTLGVSLMPAGATGAWGLRLAQAPGRHDFRLAFAGMTEAPATVGVSSVVFAVPAPGAGALVGVAVLIARRRRI